MIRVFTLNVIAAILLGLSTGASAAEIKPKAEASPAAPTKKSSDASAAAPSKAHALPMYSRVDSIDHTNKTFTTKRKKDGVEIKHILPAAAEVRQNNASARFSEIKVGDWVAGSRLKKSDTEYEIVKITKFGPRADKKE
jgi:hypothetical protein